MSQNEPTRKYQRGKDDAATLSEGGALAGAMLPDQHKADFTEIDIIADKTTWNLKDANSGVNSSVLSNPSVKLNKQGKPLTYGVVPYDPVTGKAFGSTNPLSTQLISPTGIYTVYIGQALDGNNAPTTNYLFTASLQLFWNANTNLLERTRTPTVWKSALISANGSTAIWTSAVGKKARLMGIRITLINATTAAAACLLKVLDVAADTGIGVQICGAAMGAVGTSSIIVNETYMNGYLMAATNTAININLSSVLAVAGVFVQVWGTEE